MPRIKRVIDCSHPMYNGAPRWIGLPPLEVLPNYFFLEGTGSNNEYVRMFTHCGTHLDLPYHMLKGGKRVGDFPPECFMGEAIMLDASQRKGNRFIELEDLKPKYDEKIKKDDIVVIYTGWGEKRGYNADWLKNFPTLTPECARWIAGKKVKGVATDSMGFDAYPAPPERPVHLSLLPHMNFLAEEVYLPKEVLERERWWFEALPWRLDEAGGTPTRAVLIEWEEE